MGSVGIVFTHGVWMFGCVAEKLVRAEFQKLLGLGF